MIMHETRRANTEALREKVEYLTETNVPTLAKTLGEQERFAKLSSHAEYSDGWMAVAFSSGERHAVPINDLHSHEETPMCWCKPVTVRGVWAHNAADGRERQETNH